VAGRLRRLVPPAVLAAGLRTADPPAWRPLAAGLGIDPAPQSGPLTAPEHDATFRAVGASRPFEVPEFWTDRSDGLLFLFYLHGFTPLATYAATGRTAGGDMFWEKVASSWLESERRPRLPAWHPYPTSERIIAWSAALSCGWNPRLADRLRRELWRQARYLERAIERDVGGNHVLKNGVALVFAGAVCGSGRMLDRALALLERETGRQLLSDGGHQERSTSYHRQVTHDLGEVAELIARAGRPTPPWLEQAVDKATGWQAAMAGPDGRLPLLNDAWEGPPVSPPARASESWLADTGYAVLRHGDDQLIFDAGPISPPHLPPHAHADVGSFVLWADGQPVVVDPGSYSYTGEARNAFRGTGAHNTVEVDGADQCELWGDFRAAFHPNVAAGAPRPVGDAVVVDVQHDGYRRLPDPVVHLRTVVWFPGDGVVVVDRLSARRSHEVRSRLHIAPSAFSEGTRRAGPFVVEALGEAPAVRRKEGAYAPYLGKRIPCAVLEDVRMVSAGVPFGWSLLRPGRRVLELTAQAVVIERGNLGTVSVALDGEGRW
jgi:uncharacterized heparinase superfamily protein